MRSHSFLLLRNQKQKAYNLIYRYSLNFYNKSTLIESKLSTLILNRIGFYKKFIIYRKKVMQKYHIKRLKNSLLPITKKFKFFVIK